MHRATPANTSFRSYVAGGARATVHGADDSKLMQEHKSGFMLNELRQAIESPQNYGFTSVVADAIKDAEGKIQSCAETFISFMGGNRSFPVAGNMDDRRHRLQNLEKGDVAIFRQAQDFLQMHFNKDGGFMTGPRDKTVRLQLLDKDSGQQQQQGAGAATFDASSGSTGSGQQQKPKMGQQSIYKDGQSSYRFVEVLKDKTRSSGPNVHLALQNGKTYLHCADDNQVYVGAERGKQPFSKIITLAGPMVNGLGNIGSATRDAGPSDFDFGDPTPVPWVCAHGDSPPATLPCATTVPLNSVPTNMVVISGSGTISSFGPGSLVTKRVEFSPGITLQNSPQLMTLTGADRVISTVAFGVYACDDAGNWTEESFTGTGAAITTAAPGLWLSRQVFTASQPVTIPPTATSAHVLLTGAGGSYNGSSPGPGGGGGTVDKRLTGLVGGLTLSLTIGQAGINRDGDPSYLTSGTQTIPTLTADGGQSSLSGGGGGGASGGDLNIPGGNPTQVLGMAVGGATVTGFGKGSTGAVGDNGGCLIDWYT